METTVEYIFDDDFSWKNGPGSTLLWPCFRKDMHPKVRDNGTIERQRERNASLNQPQPRYIIKPSTDEHGELSLSVSSTKCKLCHLGHPSCNNRSWLNSRCPRHHPEGTTKRKALPSRTVYSEYQHICGEGCEWLTFPPSAPRGGCKLTSSHSLVIRLHYYLDGGRSGFTGSGMFCLKQASEHFSASPMNSQTVGWGFYRILNCFKRTIRWIVGSWFELQIGRWVSVGSFRENQPVRCERDSCLFLTI